MSTQHSSQDRVSSKLAVQAAASSQAPRKKSRNTPPSSAPSARVQEIPASVQEVNIVQRVTDAVTHRLASGSSSTQPATSSTTPAVAPSATLHEVPMGPHTVQHHKLKLLAQLPLLQVHLWGLPLRPHLLMLL